MIDLSREECDAKLAKAILGAFGQKATEKTQQRLVRSLLRLAARFELKLGHNRDAFVALATKAVLDVEQELAVEAATAATKKVSEL